MSVFFTHLDQKFHFKVLFLILIATIVLGGCTEAKTMGDGSNVAESGTEIQKAEGYDGELLAGKGSLYLAFNKTDYDKAVAEGKTVFLDFYADWCPICRAEAPEIKVGFDGLGRDDVVGFRVNYNDPDTDDFEKALAREFNIPYQHTKVILKNGKEVFRSGDSWTAEDFSKTIRDY